LKNCFIYIIVLFFSTFLNAQQSNFEFNDTLEEDSLKMVQYANRSKTIYQNNLDSALILMNKALAIAKQNNYESSTCDYTKSIGIFYYHYPNYYLAIENLKQAQVGYKKRKDTENEADALLHIGLCHHEIGNFNLALDAYYQSLKLFESTNDSLGIGRSLNNLGTSLEALGENQSAINLYKKALHFKRKSNDIEGVANVYINIGNIYMKANEDDSATYYHKLAVQAASLLKNKRTYVNSLISLAKSNYENNNYQAALNLYEKAKNEFNPYRNDYQLAILNNGIAQVYAAQENYIKAIQYLESNIKLAKRIGAKDLLKNAYLLYAEVNFKYGGNSEAYLSLKEYVLLKDSLFDSERLLTVAEMQEKYKSDKKQKEISDLQYKINIDSIKNEKQTQITRILVITLIVFLTFVIVLIWLLFKNRKKSNVINKSLLEKEVLIKEVHHRVKNNFQLISSLLNLQTDLIEDEAALRAINDTRSRITSMSLVHKNLYMTENLTSLNMNDYFSQLTSSILTSFEIKDNSIQVDIDAKDIYFDVDTAVPLGLMVNELFTNAIKYAFIDKSSGKIIIKLQKIEKEDKYQLIFSDNGVGIPSSVDLDNLNSLGLELVQLLVAQLNGRLEMQTENGTHFKIYFFKA
jgi:two-component system, sensor histidine kinase PdtaS